MAKVDFDTFSGHVHNDVHDNESDRVFLVSKLPTNQNKIYMQV